MKKSLCLWLLLVLIQVNAREMSPPPPEALKPPSFVPTRIDFNFQGISKPDEEVGDIYLVDESADQVLTLLGDLTKKKVISTNDLPSVSINFDSQGSMTRSEAIDAIESLLSLNGIGIAEMGDTFIRVLPNSQMKSKSPDMLFHSSMLIPPSEKVYSKLFRVRYMKWDEATSLVNGNLTQGVGSCELFPSSKSMLVKDSLVNIQRLESLLTHLDVPSSEAIIVRTLEHISAEELKTILTQQFGNELASFIDGKISITADTRSNQLVFVTDNKNQPLIDRLVKTYDADTHPLTTTEVIHLKYAASPDVVTLLNSIINSQKENNRNDKSQGALQVQNTPEKPKNIETVWVDRLQFSDYIAIVNDERSNSVVVYGTESDITNIKNLVSEIDTVLPQVRIDVVITEVTLNSETSRGLEKFGVSYDENDEIVYNLNEDSGLPWSIEGSITDFFLNSWTISDFTLSAVFDTAKKDSDVTVLSAPTIVTTHNREAIINAGESRPVITATERDTTGLNTQSQVQFKDIGIKLKIKPLIGNDGVVQLEIEQTVESVVDEVLIDGNSQPVIGKREATSYITVGDGDLVVMGGLQEKTVRKTGGRMVLLGSIPILGKWLFSSKRDYEVNRELIIFIKPTVFQNVEMLVKNSSKLAKRVNDNRHMSEFLSRSGIENEQESMDTSKHEAESDPEVQDSDLPRANVPGRRGIHFK